MATKTPKKKASSNNKTEEAKAKNVKKVSKSVKNESIIEDKNERHIDVKVLASLLVAIIFLLLMLIASAYAYFTLSATGSSTRSATTTIADAGTAALVNPTGALHVHLDGISMAEANIGDYYYATSNVGDDYESSANPRVIARATITGGDTNVNYSCTFTLNVSKTGTMTSVIQAGDAEVIFSGAYSATVDLASIFSTRTITMNNLSGSNRTEELLAVVRFHNTSNVQDYLQGKAMTISFSNSSFSCTN